MQLNELRHRKASISKTGVKQGKTTVCKYADWLVDFADVFTKENIAYTY